jgi:Mg2+-importing ATPase
MSQRRGAEVGSDGVPKPTSAKWLGYLAALVVAGLLVYAVVVASGGMRDAAHQLRHASRVWLVPALALEIASYAIAGWLLRLLRGNHDSLSWVTAARVALVMWGLGSLLPASPAEGIALSVSELGRRGVGRQHALTMLLLAGWFQFWALVLTAAVASAVVDAVGTPDPDDATRLLVIAAVLTILTVTAVSLARRPIIGKLVADAIWWLPRHRKMTRDEFRAAGVVEHARVVGLLGRPVHRFGIAMASTGWWIADAGGLWIALHAAHAHVDFGLVVLAYVAGTVASWVPLLPGGLGAVEIAVPAVLHHFGVPLTVALTGTLLWRGLSLFVPALGGALAYASLRAEQPLADT